MSDRDSRIESYYQESAWELATLLVDREDEIEVWKGKVIELTDKILKGRDG